MLRWRILLGVTFSAVLAALCWLDAQAAVLGAWLLPVVLLVALLGTHELAGLLAAHVPDAIGPAVYLGNLGIVLANWCPHMWPRLPLDPGSCTLVALAGALLLVLTIEVLRFRAPAGQSVRLAGAALALTYIGVLLSFLVQLRFAGPHGQWGLTAIVSLLLVVKLADIGAYVVGRLLGRHKLARHLSPGKTIEGGIGGLLFSVAGAWLALVFLFPRFAAGSAPQLAPWQWIGFGITVGVAGMIGDLAESLLKRDGGRKDSSQWMPGFGGVLDLIDSLLVAAPVAYLWWTFGLALR